MKTLKKVVAAAVTAVGVVCAAECSIESANIVGYRDGEKLTRGWVTMIAAPFADVGDAEGTDFTLGKLIPVEANADNPLTFANFELYLVDMSGEVAFIDDDEIYPPLADNVEFPDGDVLASFGYLTESAAAEAGASKPGWYLKNGKTHRFEYCMNDYELPIGMGYCIKSTASKTAKISFAGQVLKKSIDQRGTRGWVLATGNSTPVDRTLKDFEFIEFNADNPVTFANSELFLVDMSGEVAFIDDSDIYPPLEDPSEFPDGDVLASFGFLTEAAAIEAGAAGPGWYLKNGKTHRFEYCMGDYEIPAGRGFCIKSTASKVSHFIIPSPIPPKE